ncbi:MAG: type II toxin-antitoxin system Phd/YefM family antitoxin [Spirochaetaceae bacterium]|nr:MAG: type II toxin-antitoxin system Phd/YefM family antitoxin [Spirochaetaceae bacterium]
MTRIPLFDAKNRLSAVVHDVESGSPVELTRHGKPVAVLLGADAYRRRQNEHQTFGHLFDRFVQQWPVDDASGDEHDENLFADVRSRDAGRPVDL